jgi:aldose sugar dehydrogenase
MSRDKRYRRSGLILALISTLLAGAAAAPVAAQTPNIRAETVTAGLEHPWAVAFIGSAKMLVSERPGRLRAINAQGEISPPLGGLPTVDSAGQGGLLDLITDHDFAHNRTIYFCFSEPALAGPGNSTALASARLSDDSSHLERVTVIFRQQPKVSSRAHFGCRIVEARDGALFLTLGERYARMANAQTPDNHHGKIVRIGKDGSIPPDNPFVGRVGARPEIWSYGHRNTQGAALAADGSLWTHEHGPQGGDEVNRPQAGKNYGWPVITYGKDYGGGTIGEGLTASPGMEQPLHHWTPSIAPSGMTFVHSTRYGKNWQGSLLVGSLKFGELRRLEINGQQIGREESVLQLPGQRIRDVREGPDGYIYLLTDAANGKLIRLLAK